MTIEYLKTQIENQTNIKHLIIFIYEDTDFLAFQYINAISSAFNLEVSTLEDLNAIPKSSMFSNNTNSAYIYEIDKLDRISIPNDYYLFVICKSLDKVLDIPDEYIVYLPKLTTWMISDYIYSKEKLSDDKITALITRCNSNMYRIDSELFKLEYSSFDEVYNNLIDLSAYTVFDLGNAIVRRDKQSINYILSQNVDNIDAFALVGVLRKQFRQIIDIQLNPKPSAQYSQMSDKQFYVVKTYNCNKYSKTELVNIFNFLNNFDIQIRSGQLTNIDLLSYILVNIL